LTFYFLIKKWEKRTLSVLIRNICDIILNIYTGWSNNFVQLEYHRYFYFRNRHHSDFLPPRSQKRSVYPCDNVYSTTLSNYYTLSKFDALSKSKRVKSRMNSIFIARFCRNCQCSFDVALKGKKYLRFLSLNFYYIILCTSPTNLQ